MKRMFKLVSFFMLAILILSGCNTKNEEEDVFKFRDSYIGDNSAVGSIVNQLQEAEHFKVFELETKEQPYGIILNYDWSAPEQDYKKAAIYNATFLFTLVRNADWTTFNFDNQEYKLTREDLQGWYGEDLSNLKNENETKELTEKYLEDENKINQLFN